LETTLNVDETGHKENGALFWTWVFKADLYVLFRIDKSRGSQALVMHKSIEDRIGQGRIANDGVPVGDGQLTGH
jgi:hypothetical protein